MGSRSESDTGSCRKLEDIQQDLTLPVEHGDVMGFLADTENVQRINDLLEDVHVALMVYRVCMPGFVSLTPSDVCGRPPCKKISIMRVVDTL